MHTLRRQKLRLLLEGAYQNDRRRFLEKSGISKGRLSQLLDPDEPFGDVAARNLEDKLQLEPGYFDAMDARTVEFAPAFESLPLHLKDKWGEIVKMLNPS